MPGNSAFSLVELLSAMGVAILIMGASAQLWSSVGRHAGGSPAESAQALATLAQHGVQIARSQQAPVALAVTEVEQDGVAQTLGQLLSTSGVANEHLAVGWPTNLGSTRHWQEVGPALRLPGVGMAAGTGGPAPTAQMFARADATGVSRTWRLVSMITPAGEWAIAPLGDRGWTLLTSSREVTLVPARPGSVPGASVQLHAASSRPLVQLAP